MNNTSKSKISEQLDFYNIFFESRQTNTAEVQNKAIKAVLDKNGKEIEFYSCSICFMLLVDPYECPKCD